MLEKGLSLVLSIIMSQVAVQPVVAGWHGGDDATQVARVKADIARRGLGENAFVRVKLRDNNELNGYISEAGEDRFVVTVAENNASTAIPVGYNEVTQVKSKRHGIFGTLTGKLGLGLTLGLMVTATVATLAFANVGY